MIENSVFISGSIVIKTLSQEVKNSIHKIVDNQMKILVGDANGIDSLVQDYCLSLGYFNVTVYSISSKPRYKASDKFDLKTVTPPTEIKGARERQREKDKAMTKDSQYSFIIWDGKSKGSYANILCAFEQDKKIKLYAENRFLKQHEINQQNIKAIYRKNSEYTTINSYPKRVAENILPLSLSGELSEVFKEWYFTEVTEDHEDIIESCQLCNQEQLRYHFEIKNKYTQKTLMVGSSCILKFGVAVDKDTILNKKDSKKKLDLFLTKMRLESCLKSLEKLAIKENNDILKNALDYYLKNKYLTPKFAFVVFWQLQKNKIEHTPSFFKISLKRKKFKEDLEEMDTFKVHKFWKALTSSQKKLAIKYGHVAP